MGAGHVLEREDQCDECAGRRERVLQQLQADVGRQVRGHDARPDHGDEQEERPDELADEAAPEGDAHTQQLGVSSSIS